MFRTILIAAIDSLYYMKSVIRMSFLLSLTKFCFLSEYNILINMPVTEAFYDRNTG